MLGSQSFDLLREAQDEEVTHGKESWESGPQNGVARLEDFNGRTAVSADKLACGKAMRWWALERAAKSCSSGWRAER